MILYKIFGESGLVTSMIAACATVGIITFVSNFCNESSIWKARQKFIIVITGCDSGFGQIAAAEFAKLKFKVIATCLTKEGVDKLAGVVTKSIICDITKSKDIQALYDCVSSYSKDSGNQLGVLINNAGVAIIGGIDWQTLEAHEKMMSVNYLGAVAVTKSLLPLLKRTPGSRVINMSSMAGLSPTCPLMGGYAASKHALEAVMNTLRLELLPWKIFVCNINPAFMRTPMVTDAKSLMLSPHYQEKESVQYNMDEVKSVLDLVNKFAENPQLVIKAMVTLVRSAAPARQLIPGYGGTFMYYSMVLLPSSITDIFHHIYWRSVLAPKPEALIAVHSKREREA